MSQTVDPNSPTAFPPESEGRTVSLDVLAVTPEEQESLRVAAPQDYAAGTPGVYRAVKHLLSQAGAVNATRTMLKLNQKGGIDCMSCAWPESDKQRHTAEFCEN